MFDMRIYNGEFTVKRILEQCRTGPDHRDSFNSYAPSQRAGAGEVDIPKLMRIVDRIPVEEIRARRKQLNVFYEEVLVSADPERGVSFSACLMILAHYKIIVDSKSLRLEEFLRRRTRLQRVEEAVRRNTVIGFFDTLYWSRQFRRRIENRKSARLTAVPQFSIPEILVDDQPRNDELEGDSYSKGDDQFAQKQTPGTRPSIPSPTSSVRSGTRSPTRPSLQIDTSGVLEGPSSSEWSRIGASLSPRHTTEFDVEFRDRSQSLSAQSAQSSHSGSHSRDNSVIVQDMMQSLGDSAWGQSIRRSFTQRRPGSKE